MGNYYSIVMWHIHTNMGKLYTPPAELASQQVPELTRAERIRYEIVCSYLCNAYPALQLQYGVIWPLPDDLIHGHLRNIDMFLETAYAEDNDQGTRKLIEDLSQISRTFREMRTVPIKTDPWGDEY